MMSIANITRIKIIFNFDISTDSCVKIFSPFNNVVGILITHYFYLKITFESLYPFIFYAIA